MDANDNHINPNTTEEQAPAVNDDNIVQLPRVGAINDNLIRVSEQTRTRNRPANTSKAYDKLKIELIQFLEYTYAGDPFRLKLDENKVYRFLFYQCAREKLHITVTAG